MKLGEVETRGSRHVPVERSAFCGSIADRIERLNRFVPFELMRFTLTYDGDLHASGNKDRRAAEKWRIRKAIEPQLMELWRTHPAFRGYGFVVPRPIASSDRLSGNMPIEQSLENVVYTATAVRVDGKPFLPIVRRSLHLTCKLHITFLRKGEPGALISEGGDIDNRLKTLLDGLSMPSASEVAKGNLGTDPFYSLMENDNLITGLHVNTDRLLTPGSTSSAACRLLIDVSVQVMRVTELNVGFIGD